MVGGRIAHVAERALARSAVVRQAALAVADRPRTRSTRLARFLAANDVLPERVVVRQPAGSFVMHPGRPVDLVARQVWLDGPTAFERPLPEVLLGLPIGNGEVVVVGANSGYYAMTLAVGTGAPVRAHEPYPPAYERLRANVAASGLDDQVSVRSEAVAAQPGRATLHVPRPHHDRWPLEGSASLDPTFKTDHTTPVEVDVVRLDDVVDGTVALLFVDAEGTDLDVLAGADGILRRDRPLVVVEVTDLDVAPLEAFLADQDYGVATMSGHGIRWQDRPHEPEHVAAVEDSATRRVYWSALLVPRERTEEVRRSLTARGLRCAGGRD